MRGKSIAILAKELGFNDPKPLSIALKNFIYTSKITRQQYAKVDDNRIQELAVAFTKRHARKYWNVQGRNPFYPDDEVLIIANLKEILANQRRNTVDALKALERKHGSSTPDFDGSESENYDELDASLEDLDAEVGDVNKVLSTLSSRFLQSPASESSPTDISHHRSHSLAHEGNKPTPPKIVTVQENGSMEGEDANIISAWIGTPHSRKRKFDEEHEQLGGATTHVTGSMAETTKTTKAKRLMIINLEPEFEPQANTEHPPGHNVSLPLPPPSSGSTQISVPERGLEASLPYPESTQTRVRIDQQIDKTGTVSTTDAACQTDAIGRLRFEYGGTTFGLDRANSETFLTSSFNLLNTISTRYHFKLCEALERDDRKEVQAAEISYEVIKHIRSMLKKHFISNGAWDDD